MSLSSLFNQLGRDVSGGASTFATRMERGTFTKEGISDKKKKKKPRRPAKGLEAGVQDPRAKQAMGQAGFNALVDKNIRGRSPAPAGVAGVGGLDEMLAAEDAGDTAPLPQFAPPAEKPLHRAASRVKRRRSHRRAAPVTSPPSGGDMPTAAEEASKLSFQEGKDFKTIHTLADNQQLLQDRRGNFHITTPDGQGTTIVDERVANQALQQARTVAPAEGLTQTNDGFSIIRTDPTGIEGEGINFVVDPEGRPGVIPEFGPNTGEFVPIEEQQMKRVMGGGDEFFHLIEMLKQPFSRQFAEPRGLPERPPESRRGKGTGRRF